MCFSAYRSLRNQNKNFRKIITSEKFKCLLIEFESKALLVSPIVYIPLYITF